ncbi:tetraspanin-6-like [Maniola hyperantus]|uniref:tetraspanin-6-like n=1 Tax=Aphantopus hyperantus TaxID=2795564 RepID=UPI0037496B91
MLLMYTVLLLVIIILQVILGLLVFKYGSIVSDTIKSLTVDFNARSPENLTPVPILPDEFYYEIFEKLRSWEYTNFFLTTQEKFSCCGASGKSDYGLNGYIIPVLDKSCCPTDAIECTPDEAYEEGCLLKLVNMLEEWKPVIIGVPISVICFQVIVAVLALSLTKAIGDGLCLNAYQKSKYFTAKKFEIPAKMDKCSPNCVS